MKKNIFILCIGFIVCTAFMNPPEDYRDSYVGTYFCRSKCESLSSNYTEILYHTDTITIAITKNTRDSILDISVRGRSLQVKLINGIMVSYEQSIRNQGRFFSTDSIAFSSSSSSRIPNGCSYRGKKE